ncbi:hypothetical protein [Pseudomarimonas arenosa]|uniref:Uncharacterized protein n=1 Tax=Pseudomarimonas arenosa TaxID=2774145 RepID=A0AAW3ZVB5_9GAMM|nr:hypothetical protein [Pseudomarimonas arenosa]MBD8528232.1 hypothetical protein [Pseudomarimonas arenosa]
MSEASIDQYSETGAIDPAARQMSVQRQGQLAFATAPCVPQKKTAPEGAVKAASSSVLEEGNR